MYFIEHFIKGGIIMDLRSNIHGYYKQDHKSSVSSNIELTFSRNPNLQWIYQPCKYFKALRLSTDVEILKLQMANGYTSYFYVCMCQKI